MLFPEHNDIAFNMAAFPFSTGFSENNIIHVWLD